MSRPIKLLCDIAENITQRYALAFKPADIDESTKRLADLLKENHFDCQHSNVINLLELVTDKPIKIALGIVTEKLPCFPGAILVHEKGGVGLVWGDNGGGLRRGPGKPDYTDYDVWSPARLRLPTRAEIEAYITEDYDYYFGKLAEYAANII